jgi:hypothetical protein
MKNRGQVTIFVIISVVIVIGLILFFLFRNSPEIAIRDAENPDSFIDDCVRESVKDNIRLMMKQGGFVIPSDEVVYEDERVAYLCKNENYYEKCVNQYPVLIARLEKELSSEIENDVGQCFTLLEDELKRKNYVVNRGDIFIESFFKPGIVEIKIKRDFEINKEGLVRKFKEFNVELKSYSYELISLAELIVSSEAEFCYFSNDEYMSLHPEIDVRKDVLSDSTIVYTLKYKENGEGMRFAVRGCALPLVGQ